MQRDPQAIALFVISAIQLSIGSGRWIRTSNLALQRRLHSLLC